jgi:type I restriction enzyme, S subunit
MGSEQVRWEEATVGEIADVVGGGTPKTAVGEYWGEDIGWLTPKDLRNYGARYISRGERNITNRGLEESAARLLPTGTVLVSSRAPIGYVAIAATAVATNQGFKSLVLKQGYVPEFYYYVMKTKTPEMEAVAGGSTFKEISGRVMKTIPVPVPPFAEQRAIAEVLGALDDRIEWCDAGVALAYELQDALFAELNAQQELPRQPLGDFTQLDKGVSYKGADVTDDPTALALVNLGNFGRGRAPRWEKLKHYMGQTRPRHHVSPGDVVVCATDMTHDRIVLGKALVVPERLADAAVSHHLYAMRLRPDSPVSPWLVALALSHEPIRRVVASFANGTTVLALPRDAVQRVEVPVPSPKQLEAFDASVVELQAAIESANDEAATLRRIRDTLLPRLLSGEVRIEDPERVLGAVA